MIKSTVFLGGSLLCGVILVPNSAADGAAPAEPPHPCGLYKPDDIARAKENIKRHKWAGDVLGNYKKLAQFWMSLPDDQIPFWIPDEIGARGCLCPKCSTNGAWELSADGTRAKCKKCGLVIPGNNDYKESKSFSIKDPAGTVRQIPYYEGKTQFIHTENIGEKYYLSGVVLAKRLEKLGLAHALGIAHAITGEPEYAQKARKMLLKFAELYPHCIPQFRQTCYDSYSGHLMAGKISSWKIHDSELVISLANAYDLTLSSGVYNADDRKKIETGIFLEYKKLITAHSPMSDWCQNAVPYHYAAALLSAIILKDREFASWVIEGPEGYKSFIKKYFHRDGHWYENSPAYELMALGPLNIVPEALKGSLIFKDYDLSGNPLSRKIFSAAAFAQMPDGALPAINDSDFNYRYPLRNAEINYFLFPTEENKALVMSAAGGGINDTGDIYSLFRRDPDLSATSSEPPAELTESLLRPGPGWAVLRTSAKEKDSALILNYGPICCGHSHRSLLNLIYYDFSKELVTDLGYLSWPHPDKPWMTSAPAHNQVIVNGAPPPEKACGRLEAFSCGGKVKAVTTSANDAYKGVTEIYRRQTIFVDRAPGRRYLVDFFEVKGGKDHQLTFHADGETFKAPELDWTPQNTADLGNPETGYKWLKDCKSASSQGILSCQWISDPKSGLGTNLWMLPDGDTKLTLSVAHGLRDRKKPFDNVSLFPVIFRRPGPQNIFVSVIECFHGAPSIDRVEPLSVTAGKGWARAIKIHSGDTEDILITASEDAAGTTTECPALPQMKLKGRAAFISLKNNAPVYMWLMGDFIRWDKHELKGQPEIRGKITEVNSPENTVTVDSDIPESLKNEFLFIPEKFDGIYKIMAVSKTKDGKTLVKLPASEILSINQGDNFQIIPCSERQIEH